MERRKEYKRAANLRFVSMELKSIKILQQTIFFHRVNRVPRICWQSSLARPKAYDLMLDGMFQCRNTQTRTIAGAQWQAFQRVYKCMSSSRKQNKVTKKNIWKDKQGRNMQNNINYQ